MAVRLLPPAEEPWLLIRRYSGWWCLSRLLSSILLNGGLLGILIDRLHMFHSLNDNLISDAFILSDSMVGSKGGREGKG